MTKAVISKDPLPAIIRLNIKQSLCPFFDESNRFESLALMSAMRIIVTSARGAERTSEGAKSQTLTAAIVRQFFEIG